MKGCHEQFLRIIFNYCKHIKMLYIETGREKLRKWYNEQTGRNVCIGTIDRYIAELKKASCIDRKMRTTDLGIYGKQFKTSLTGILQPALHVLYRMGIDAFKIAKRISEVVRPRKKRARRAETSRARLGTAAPVGEVVSEVLKGLKGL